MKEKKKKINDKPYFVNYISWLRPAVLGANDGILSIASMMVGMIVGHASLEVIPLSGIAALVAGATAMATGEYVSVSSQYDATEASLVRKQKKLIEYNSLDSHENKAPDLEITFIKPLQAALVSAASFMAGGMIPLLIVIASPNKFLLATVIISSLSTLAFLGELGAKIGKVKILRPTLRILLLGVISLSISTIVGLLFNLNI
jgi:vacuolar iron transporter family protein